MGQNIYFYSEASSLLNDKNENYLMTDYFTLPPGRTKENLADAFFSETLSVPLYT